MPELPEVETICQALRNVLPGQVIERVDVLHKQVIQPLSEEEFIKALEGAVLNEVTRRGKYIICRFSSPVSETKLNLLVIHLRMTGQLHWADWADEQKDFEPHTHLILHFKSGSVLSYVDVRRFGRWRLYQRLEEDATLASLGPEPLGEDFTITYLQSALAERSMPIKALLLRQDVIAGLGNIYADEALFLAKVHPERAARSLGIEEIECLWYQIRFVLEESIRLGGSSMRDYMNIDGKRGHYQEHWRIYRQTGKECTECGGVIQKTKIGGRSSHFCSNCQL